jgi:hypothetical protein
MNEMPKELRMVRYLVELPKYLGKEFLRSFPQAAWAKFQNQQLGTKLILTF